MRAEVRRERRHAAVGRELRAQRAEDVDVGVAEAVDRLLLVSHEEQVVAIERVKQGPVAGDLSPAARRP